MSDPFAIATSAIFSSSIGVSGILTDTNSNQYQVRCVVQNNLSLALQGYAAQIPETKSTITFSKSSLGIALDKDDYSSVEVNGKTYSVDGVIQEDDYAITLSVIED